MGDSKLNLIMGGGNGDTNSEDWYVPASDEEGDEDTKEPYVPWTPDAKDIASMFERLEKEKVLELKWKCPGRRPPSPERGDDDDGDDDDYQDSDDDIKEEEKKMPEASEFDFDDFGMEASHKMTPRRTPGSKSTPKSQKKVASMDNVLNKIRHQQKEKAALRDAKRGMSRSPASPARFRLGMTGSPGASPRRVVSSTGTPLRPTMPEDSLAAEPAVIDSAVAQTAVTTDMPLMSVSEQPASVSMATSVTTSVTSGDSFLKDQ